MTVKQLIEHLHKLPQDACVLHVWDGEARTEIEHVWLSKKGDVVTSDNGEVLYSSDDRPVDAPTSEENQYWRSPEDTTPVITTDTTDPEDTQAGSQNVSKAKGDLDNDPI